MREAIQVRNLVKVYSPRRGEPVRALDGVSFEVRRGEIFGLLGRNGAGKTTLLRILTTLLPPDAGSVSVMGHDLASAPLEIRRSICMVLQETAVELFLSVRDNLETYGRFQSVPRPELRRRAEEALERFGLAEHRNRKVIDLSGGLKRRVQVAKVFMVDRPVIFLDEATTGMDPVNRRAALDAIRGETRRGRTVLLTTHLLQEAEELCDRIAIIDRGRILRTGDVHGIKALAAGALDVAMTFEVITPDMEEALRRIPHTRFARVNNTVELCLQGEEAPALERIAAVARMGRLLHFEASGATLEDAFLALLSDPSNPGGKAAPPP